MAASLSAPQREVLEVLAQASAAVSHAALCEALSRHSDTIKTARVALARRELIVKVGDGRSTAYEITKGGREALSWGGDHPKDHPTATGGDPPSTTPRTTPRVARGSSSNVLPKSRNEENGGSSGGTRSTPPRTTPETTPERLGRLLEVMAQTINGLIEEVAELKGRVSREKERIDAEPGRASPDGVKPATCLPPSEPRTDHGTGPTREEVQPLVARGSVRPQRGSTECDQVGHESDDEVLSRKALEEKAAWELVRRYSASLKAKGKRIEDREAVFHLKLTEVQTKPGKLERVIEEMAQAERAKAEDLKEAEQKAAAEAKASLDRDAAIERRRQERERQVLHAEKAQVVAARSRPELAEIERVANEQLDDEGAPHSGVKRMALLKDRISEIAWVQYGPTGMSSLSAKPTRVEKIQAASSETHVIDGG